ncbi:MAG: hypothetical protein U5N86_09885 [Planctomycetota bacterium]|nr:hypothetical protein [Planctomycetota bacterium]
MGFQFHPEMDERTGNTCFSKDGPMLAEKGFDVEKILSATRDDGSGKVLFRAFVNRWQVSF